eukprot:scaffold5.g663.t1
MSDGVLCADGTPLQPTGRLTPAQVQAASVPQLDGDVAPILTTTGDRLVPILISNMSGYYVLEKHKVLSGGEEYTPTGFETLAGKAACRKWRLSMRVWMEDGGRGKTLGQWLADHGLEHTVPQPGKRKQAGDEPGGAYDASMLDGPLPARAAAAAATAALLRGGSHSPHKSPYAGSPSRTPRWSEGPEASVGTTVRLVVRAGGSPCAAVAHHYYHALQQAPQQLVLVQKRAPAPHAHQYHYGAPAGAAPATTHHLQQQPEHVAYAAHYEAYAGRGGGGGMEGEEEPVTPLTALLNAYFAEPSGEGSAVLRPSSEEKHGLLALLQARRARTGRREPAGGLGGGRARRLRGGGAEELPSDLPPHLQPPIISLPSDYGMIPVSSGGLSSGRLGSLGKPGGTDAAPLACARPAGPAEVLRRMRRRCERSALHWVRQPQWRASALRSVPRSFRFAVARPSPRARAGLESLPPSASWPTELIRMPPELAVSDAGIAALARTLPDRVVQEAPPLPPHGLPSPARPPAGAGPACLGLHHQVPGSSMVCAASPPPSPAPAPAAGGEEPAVQQLSELKLQSPAKAGAAPQRTYSLQAFATAQQQMMEPGSGFPSYRGGGSPTPLAATATLVPLTPATLSARPPGSRGGSEDSAQSDGATAQRQREALWGLADRLVAAERGRARAAERQLWDARFCARQLEQQAAEGLAAREQQAELQRQLAVQQERAAGLEEELAEAGRLLTAVRQAAERAQEAAQRERAEFSAALEEQRRLAEARGEEAGRLRVRLSAAEVRAGQAEEGAAQLAGQLESEREHAASQARQAEEREARLAAEARELRQHLEESDGRGRVAAAEAAELASRLRASEEALEAERQVRRVAEQQARALGEERQRLLARLGEADSHVERLAGQVSELVAANQVLHGEGAAAQATARQAQAQLAEALERAQEAERRAAAAQQLLRERAAELDARELMARQLRLEAEEARRAAAAAGQEAAATRASLARAQEERAEALEEVTHAELGSLQAALSAAQVRLRCLEGGEDACRAQSLAALEELVRVADAAAPRLRNALTERRVEAARSEMAAAQAAVCPVCCAAGRDTVLNCGHLLCRECAERLASCPVCRAAITSRVRAFV